MIVLDTSGLLAAIDASQRRHSAASDVLRRARVPLLLSPFVLAELDYLLATWVSARAAALLLGQVADGAYRLEPIGAEDVRRSAELIAQYGDLGVADASCVVLAERYGTRDLLTLDERHFRAIQVGGRPFRILPVDG